MLISKSAKKRVKIQVACAENTTQYLRSTSLHGLKYVGATNINLVERMFFLLSFIMVLLLSVYYITNVYEKWSASPVIVTLSAISTPITDFPFPAITICNINKARKSVVDHFGNGSTEQILLQNICFDEYENVSLSNSAAQKASSEWNIFKSFLTNISQPCHEMLMLCRFALEKFRCMEYFDPVLSDEGLCCIFNSVEPKFLYQNPLNASSDFDDDDIDLPDLSIDWTPERGYPNNVVKSKISPKPAAGSGSHLGLYIILNADVGDYYCSSTNSAGFKILLHNPTETPRISDYGLLIAPGRQTRIVITPKISTASRPIRKIPIEQRQCIFSSEANLSYFRTYSRRNCEMECFSRYIEKICGCVVYYMPRINQNTKICNRAESNCYNQIRIAMERGEDKAHQCNCKSGCDELSFSGEVSTTPLSITTYHNEQHLENFTNDDLKRDIAVVQIFYADNFFRSNVKEELIGFTEFLSNTGGLLGLFMGFSVVSLVEIVYFLTLRPYFCRKKRQAMQQNKKKTIISSLITTKKQQTWPIYYIHTPDKNQNQNSSHPIYQRPFINRLSKKKVAQWMKNTKTISCDESESVFPYLN